MDANGHWHGLTSSKPGPPRFLIIGAGSRGTAYARAVDQATDGIVAAVAEPLPFKRADLGRRYIWKNLAPQAHQSFDGWRAFISYEQSRRKRVAANEPNVEDGVDAVFVCTLDTQHAEIIAALAPLGLHVMSEKPLATTLDDCLAAQAALHPSQLFSIGHVLRYSPHNMLLRKLLLQDRVVGDVVSLEHVEPVGWWHFSHSYVRGNWRREASTAPSLLTKSCHDIDVLLWLLCSPADPESNEPPHLPAYISSHGRLHHFRRAHKPRKAGNATNCLSCPAEAECIYSAKKIYVDRHLRKGKTDWPVKIVEPEIEDIYRSRGADAAETKLLERLGEDYDEITADDVDVAARPWFGRCVWESDNDVVDDQTVTLEWDDDERAESTSQRRLAKTATFHMVAPTEAQCERRGRVYGTTGELWYDSRTISVHDFATGKTATHTPPSSSSAAATSAGAEDGHDDGFDGHGGGDEGLTRQFVRAVAAVKQRGEDVAVAQRRYIGCTLEEAVRSHAAVFAAEEARRLRKVVEWREWWAREVEGRMAVRREWEVVR